MGARHGGYAALLSAVRAPHRFRCAISSGGITDMTRQVRRARSQDGVPAAQIFWADRFGGDDAYDRDRLREISPVLLVDEDTAPILFYQDMLRSDQFEWADDMVEALEDNQVPYEYGPTRGVIQGWPEPGMSVVVTMMEQSGRFLAEHNPADPVVPTE